MKKLLLKMNLLSFILTSPMLTLFNNSNQNFSENYMEQQASYLMDKYFLFENGNYTFLWKGKQLYASKKNLLNYAKINGFVAEIDKIYLFDKNGNILFETDNDMFLLKKGTVNG